MLQHLDESIFFAINGFHAAWADGIMWYVSGKFTWAPIYAFLLYALYSQYRGKAFYWLLLFLVVCIAMNDQLASTFFKQWVQRLRPTHEPTLLNQVHMVLEPNGQPYRGGQYGFYSSHAANMFGLITMFIVLMHPLKRGVKIFLVAWASLIAYSRIYLGVHYPSDVLMGVAMGSGIGYLMAKAYLWCAHKYNWLSA
jgi:undecaprenyl-diphosphatase